MKKLVICLFAFAGLTSVNKVNAQKGFSASVKAVPQFSFLQNKDDNKNSSYDNKATFNASFGIGGAYNFTNKLGLGIDALYSLQGQRYNLGGIELNQKNEYVKVPLYFTYNSNPGNTVSFVGKIGPQVSFITSSKLDNKDGETVLSDTKDRYKSTTFGGAALAGVQFKLDQNMYLVTAARFDYDFSNAEDDTYQNYPVGRAHTYNMTAGVEVGLKYNFR
ncbi:MAG: outer membrane beta-barrel protein [Ginsengibacter sp.]